MQGRVCAGAQFRIPRRARVGRSDRPGDEQGLLQGIAAAKRLPVRAVGPSARPELDARRAGLAVLFAFLTPALLVYAGFTVYPVLRTFYNAFHAIKPQGVVEFVGVANFTNLLFAD